jgi:streptomycin 3"-adenylyltransferase
MHSDETNSQIKNAVGSISRILQGAVLGIYLHGSAVQSHLRPQSDIDLLVMTGRPVMERERVALAAALLQLSGRHPHRAGEPRCLEVMIFDINGRGIQCNPAQTEMVYGEWLRDAYERGESAGPTHDPENTLILAQAREYSFPLYGPDAVQLLPEVSSTAIRSAMRNGLAALIDGLDGDERNVLLTLARMWRTAEIGDFVAKDVAASWARPRLLERDAFLLDYARRAYLGEVIDAWRDKQTAARSVASHMREQIVSKL